MNNLTASQKDQIIKLLQREERRLTQQIKEGENVTIKISSWVTWQDVLPKMKKELKEIKDAIIQFKR